MKNNKRLVEKHNSSAHEARLMFLKIAAKNCVSNYQVATRLDNAS